MLARRTAVSPTRMRQTHSKKPNPRISNLRVAMFAMMGPDKAAAAESRVDDDHS